nr:DUF4974 domain-containing protein [Cytophagales bacterium]
MNHTKPSIASKTVDDFWVSLRNEERGGLEGVYFLLYRRIFQMGMSVVKDEDFIVECMKEVFFDLCVIVLAWTQKSIRYKKPPMMEVNRVLENWYGVRLSYPQKQPANLIISGKFHDQTLDHVLKGVSYTGRFNLEMNQDNELLTFKN